MANSTMRQFLLVRDEDLSGVSGVGVVAEGVEFSGGRCVLHWLSPLTSIAVYDSIGILLEVHGHEGRTKVQWI